MHSRSIAAIVALTTGAILGCSRGVKVESGGDVASSVIPVSASTLPAGVTIETQLDNAIGATQNQVGDRFTARVVSPVVAENGETVVPAGAAVAGVVTGVSRSNDPTRPSVIRLDFDRLQMNGRSYPFRATVERTAIPGRNNRNLGRDAATGAVAGAVLGAVLGGAELSSILVGGALGAAAGSAISLGTASNQARLPAGTRLTLRTTERVALRR